jgi:hypothetical protein
MHIILILYEQRHESGISKVIVEATLYRKRQDKTDT